MHGPLSFKNVFLFAILKKTRKQNSGLGNEVELEAENRVGERGQSSGKGGRQKEWAVQRAESLKDV